MTRTRLILGALLAVGVGLAAFSRSNRSNAGVNLNSRLVACWSAENGARDEAGGFHGALTGGVSVVSSETGKVFQFDGTRGTVLVTNAARLNFGASEDFSITARIQPQRANTPFGVMSIVDKRRVGGITAALGYSFHLEDGRIACQLAPAARWPFKWSDLTSPARIKGWWQRRKQLVPMTFSRFIAAGPDLRDGQFHDVALTLQRTSKTGGKLYVDGTVVLTFDPTKHSASLANTAPLLIGGHPDSSLNCGFQGQMGEVRLYARALSAAEVAALRKQVAVEIGDKP